MYLQIEPLHYVAVDDTCSGPIKCNNKNYMLMKTLFHCRPCYINIVFFFSSVMNFNLYYMERINNVVLFGQQIQPSPLSLAMPLCSLIFSILGRCAVFVIFVPTWNVFCFYIFSLVFLASLSSVYRPVMRDVAVL